MIRRIPALLAGAVGLLSPLAAPAQALRLDRMAAVADSAAEVLMADTHMPGMSVAVARNGEVVFTRGYGMADVEMGVRAAPETVYGITSISKQFTAAMVLRLVEDGRIALDDSITKHLPDYPAQGRLVTIRHLLNHTSGINPMRGSSAVQDPQWFRRDMTYAEMVEQFGRQPFDFEPGEKHAYNNFAYYLLGEIVGRVAGTSYAARVDVEMRVLGLPGTVFCDDRRIVPGRAESYEYGGGALTNARHVSMHVFGGSGALCSTVGDLVRWSHLLFGGEVVSSASLERMLAKTVLAAGDTVDYGFGVYLEELGGRRKVFHGGTNPWGSYLAHYPEQGLTIAVLTNLAGARDAAAEMEEALARAAFGMARADLPVTAEDIVRYEGTYTLQLGERTLDVRVFGEGGRLKSQATGQGVIRLRHEGGHTFVAAGDDDLRLVFTMEGGSATG
ncbi:MAG TPA: serine hydrolase domain-containing protein, partial [Longimicrobium sp.]|nr:serine hydrolase domain-containing protein [Longimicrobium sp.]